MGLDHLSWYADDGHLTDIHIQHIECGDCTSDLRGIL